MLNGAYGDLAGSDVVVVTVGPRWRPARPGWTWPLSMRASSPLPCGSSTGSARKRWWSWWATRWTCWPGSRSRLPPGRLSW